MISRYIIFLGGVLVLFNADLRAGGPSAPLEIFLLIGQSNMAGRGTVAEADQQTHPRIFMFSKEKTWVPAKDPMHFDKPSMVGVGPGFSFARAIAVNQPTAEIGLVPAAVGGTSLEQWMPGTANYNEAVARARAASAGGKLAGILWHQGEADSSPERVATYAARFLAMITQLRADLGAGEVPVIVGETGRFWVKAAGINGVLRSLPLVVPACACVSSEWLGDRGDAVHFSAAGARAFGQRYADAWLKISRELPRANHLEPSAPAK